MTSQRKVVVPVVAGVVAVLAIVLGVSLKWTAWITIVVVLVCCVVGGLAYLIATRDNHQVEPLNIFVPPPPAPEPQPSVQVVAVQGINLASAWPDYEFMLDATVYWRVVASPTATPHLRPGARAIDMIIERAAAVAATEPPGTAIRLQHRLNDLLGVVERDRSGRIEAWADNVRTSLFDTDAQRLRTLADIRKDKDVWEHQRRFERDRRQYLGDDVLRSTGSALVWWLSRNDTEVTQAADLIGTMARLSAVAKDEDVPDLFRHLLPSSLLPPPEPEQSRFAMIGSDGAGQPLGLDLARFANPRSPLELVTALMGAMGLDDEQRAQFAARVATNIENTGNFEVAEQVRSRFDVLTDQPVVEEEPTDPADGTEPGSHAQATNGGNPWTDGVTAENLDD
jgi:hypothetical protein